LDYVQGQWGSVELDPEPNDPCAPEYPAGTSVTLTAVPIQGKAFARWEIYDPNHPNDLIHMATDSNNPMTLVMNADQHVTAVFKCGSGVEPAILPALPALLAALAFRRKRGVR
jgi:hypothetical protein